MPMSPLPPATGPAGPAGPAAPAGAGRKEEPGSVDSAFTAMLAALVGAQLPMIQVQSAQTPESATETPTVTPAVTSTMAPAVTPTMAPTVAPTVTPTVTPTVAPTVAAPVAPTVVPPTLMPAVPAATSSTTAQAVPQPAAPVIAVAPPLAEAIETLLQAQRVTPAPAEVTQSPVVTVEAPVVQAPAAVAVQASTAVKVAPLLPKAGQWLVEPVPADSVTSDANTGPTAQAAGPTFPALADILARASIRTPAESGSGQGLKAKSEREQPDTQGQTPTSPVAAFTVVHTAAAKTDAAEGAKAPAPVPSPIDPDRLMDAIAKSAVSSGDGRYTVTLRLHPEQLGEVHLQLHVVGKEVQTTLQVSTPAAQQALQSKGDELRQSLDQNGLTLSGFLVNTGQGERRRGQEFPDELANRPRRKTPTTVGTTAAAARPIRRIQTQRTRGLDTLA